MPRVKTNVKLHKFDFKKLYTDSNGNWSCPAGIIYGVRNSGKSTLLLSLLFDVKDEFGTVYLFSPTRDNRRMDGTKVFGNTFLKAFCFDEPQPGQLTKMMEFQTYLRRIIPVGMSLKDTNCLVIFDDCSSDPKIAKSPELKQLTANGRNAGFSSLFTVQHLTHIPPGVRANKEFFISTNNGNINIRKQLFEEMFYAFPSKECFNASLDHYCSRRGDMLVATTSYIGMEDTSLEKSVFKYRVRFPMPEFQMNCRIQRIIVNALCKTEDEMDDEIIVNMKKNFLDEDHEYEQTSVEIEEQEAEES